MKRLIYCFAALTLCMAVSVCCTPDDPKTPVEEKEEQEPIALIPVIRIDGIMGDWTSDKVVSNADKGGYETLSVIKGYCDADNLYLYYQTPDIGQIHNLRILVDTDGDENTGTPGEADTYAVSRGYSLMINVTSPKTAGDAACYSDMFGGDTMVGSVKMNTKSVIAADGKSAEVEMSIDRETLEALAPFEVRELRVCMFVLNSSWQVCASVPSPDVTEFPMIIKINN